MLVDADVQGSCNEWASLRDSVPFSVVSLTRPNIRKELTDFSRNYDLVVIDAPPRSDALNRSIVAASDLVAIPVEPSGLSDWASAATVTQISEIQEIREDIQAVFVINRRISGTILGNDIREHVKGHGLDVLNASICNRVVFAESLTMGKTVHEWKPNSEASKELTVVIKELEGYHGKKTNHETN